MKSLADYMAGYGAYHRDPRNRATHFLGVPIVMYSLLLAMAWLRVPIAGYELSLAMLFTIAVIAFYFRLDAALAVVTGLISLAILYVAELSARLPWDQSLWLFGASFVIGWAIQILGHVYEGRRPALLDNLFQALVAPLFLVAELFFALGLKPELRLRVERLLGERR